MKKKERRRFDVLLEEVLEALPPRLHDLIEQAPRKRERKKEEKGVRNLFHCGRKGS